MQQLDNMLKNKTAPEMEQNIAFYIRDEIERNTPSRNEL